MNAIQAIKLQRNLIELQASINQCLEELRMMIGDEDDIGIKPGDILELVAHKFGMEAGEFCRKDATPRYLLPRQTAQYLIRSVLGYSYPQISRLTGMKDHTAAFYAVKKIETLRKSNPTFDQKIREMEGELRGECNEACQ